jgi:MFS family permease
MAETGHNSPRPDTGIHLFRALRSRNYRLFFVGQTISLVGTFLTQIATVWLVYRITRSTLLLGTVAFAGQIPLFFLAPFGGVWADRWDKRRVLIITQVLSGLQSLALALVAFSNPSTVWPIVALAFCQGLINSFDMPARQAFTVEMVDDREDLSNAIALNSTMVHAARTLGPASAGFLVYYVGEAYCFLIDSLSYVAVVASLMMMRIRPRSQIETANGRAGEPATDNSVAPSPGRPLALSYAPPRRSVMAEFKEGIAYAWNSVPIRVLLLLMSLLSLTGMPAYNILSPVFADALGGGMGAGSRTLGVLQGATGVGSLICAVYLASRRSVVGLGGVIAVAGLLFGVAIIAFSYSRHLPISVAIAPIVGFGMLAVFASANTLLQTLADDDKRGRVMALFTVAFLGMAPFGNLIAGAIAQHFGGGIEGAARAVSLAGVVVIVAVLFFAAMLPAIRKIVRPIYVRKGIMPQVASGLETAETERG